MRASQNWKDYELLDASSGERLERWGDIILIRPDPQAIWKTPRLDPRWKQAHGRYHRSKSGGGSWEFYKKIPEVWSISYGNLKFNLKPMGFKHTGVFPEQAVNWDLCADIIKKADGQLSILNLFGYTGAATLSALGAGARVTHVDASKGMVLWGKENAEASHLADRPVRWLVDDCIKFVEREIRRGNVYDGIILDPPSYGRGPGGEVWQLEQRLYDFLLSCRRIMNGNSSFIMLNSYTTGFSAGVCGYMLNEIFTKKFGGRVLCDEIGLPVTASGQVLPCGATTIWTREGIL